MCVCVCVCVCVCLRRCVYIYIYIYTRVDEKVHWLKCLCNDIISAIDDIFLVMRGQISKHPGNWRKKILWSGHFKETDWKKKENKEHPRKTKKKKFSNASSVTKISLKELHTLDPTYHVWYSAPLFKWTRDNLKQLDQRTRKLFNIHYVSEQEMAKTYVSWEKKKKKRIHQYCGLRKCSRQWQ